MDVFLCLMAVMVVVVVVVVDDVIGDDVDIRVPDSCGLDGGGGSVLVAVSVVVEDMVLFSFLRGHEIGGSVFSNNIWLGAFSRSRFFWFE